MAGASDCQFGAQLGFAKTHHKITRRRKDGYGSGLGELLTIWGFPFSIYTTVEDSDFKFGIQLGFTKAHHKITPVRKSGHGLGLEKLPKILWFHFNIYTMAEARDFKFGIRLGFAKTHHKPHPEDNRAWPWVKEAPIYLGFPFNISATAALSS